MGFFSPEKTGMMPMNTEADDYSYRLKWRSNKSAGSEFIIGHEYFDYQLTDWWPALENSMMMGPNDYININDGQRQRVTAFAEIVQDLNPAWWWSLGIRVEHVRTNAGEVQAYRDDSTGGMGMSMNQAMDMRNTSNFIAAQQFNSMDRARSDSLIDLSLLLRHQLNANQKIEFGLARKNRAPNLYERYSWGVSTMATTMIGWFGDGNGYVGDADLKPETAHTLSATYSQNAVNKTWQFSANLWYSMVNDYIDAEVIAPFNRTTIDAGKRNILQFTNMDASLYGAKLSATVQLSDSREFGLWQLNARLTSTRGKRDDNDESLYQIIPLQTEFNLSQQIGDWQNTLSWQWLASKNDVDNRRLENRTDSYHLINFESQLSLQALTLTFNLENIFDSYYELPLGGVSIAEYKMDPSQGFRQLAGAGRSVNLGLSYSF